VRKSEDLEVRRKPEAPSRGAEDEVAAVEAALTILANYSPDSYGARLEYFDGFIRSFERFGVEPPEWIEDLRRRIEGNVTAPDPDLR
jgi:hypothetical protein